MNKDAQQKVLATLQKNARLTAEEIGERLLLDADEVRQFIADAEKNGEIHGYCTLVDSHALPPLVRAIIEVKVRPQRDSGFEDVAARISKFSEVSDVTLVSGGYDFSVVVVGETLQDVADFVATKLAPIDGIIEHSTHFVLRKYKEAGVRFNDDETFERLSVAP
jgi:DNA-binding Lrp family transcriptional regulator